jgi:hypothetical protein
MAGYRQNRANGSAGQSAILPVVIEENERWRMWASARLVPWPESNICEKRCEIGLSRNPMNVCSQPYERFQLAALRAEKSGDPRRCQRRERIACEAVENLFILREGPQT